MSKRSHFWLRYQWVCREKKNAYDIIKLSWNNFLQELCCMLLGEINWWAWWGGGVRVVRAAALARGSAGSQRLLSLKLCETLWSAAFREYPKPSLTSFHSGALTWMRLNLPVSSSVTLLLFFFFSSFPFTVKVSSSCWERGLLIFVFGYQKGWISRSRTGPCAAAVGLEPVCNWSVLSPYLLPVLTSSVDSSKASGCNFNSSPFYFMLPSWAK